mmetsp:Transcript_29555/g.80862  ORF Transcript_29555/g.80862 Transcript_29555/m.80862 type:complete len:82 (-) Transcript_29555:1023-1268(-)
MRCRRETRQSCQKLECYCRARHDAGTCVMPCYDLVRSSEETFKASDMYARVSLSICSGISGSRSRRCLQTGLFSEERPTGG